MTALVQIRQWSELHSWSPVSEDDDADAPWPWVELSALLTPITDSDHPPHDSGEIGLAGVRWYGEGVFERERRTPDQLSSKYSRLVEGALVYNRLFAWKQSFAVVDAAASKLYVSKEFPQFLPTTAELTAEYAVLVLSSPYYADRIFRRSTGSTAVSRNRLKEHDFLQLKFPLPPRHIQDVLVKDALAAEARKKENAKQIEARRTLAWTKFERALGFDDETESVQEPHAFTVRFADCERWDVEAARRVERQGGSELQWARFEEFAEVSGGIQKSPSNRPGLLARPYLRVANVRRGKLDLTEVKTIEVSAEKLSKLKLEPGDMLFVEGNGSVDEIGRSALWAGEIENCVHQNHLIRARIFSPLLKHRFALAWFNSTPGRQHLVENARTTSGLLTLNLENIRSAPVPLLPAAVQVNLAEELWGELEAADRLEEECSTVAAHANRLFREQVFGSAS